MREDLKTITKEEYNKMKNVCFICPDMDLHYQDLHYYFDWLDVCYTQEAIEKAVERAKKIEVRKQVPLTIEYDWLRQTIEDKLIKDFDIDFMQYTGHDVIAKFVEDFNRAQKHFVPGEIVAYLDLSKEAKEHLEKELNNYCAECTISIE